MLGYLIIIVFRQYTHNFPNEIIPDRLFLGSYLHARDPTIMEVLGITHIVNISDTCENYLEKSHRK